MNTNTANSKTGLDFGLEYSKNYSHDVLSCEVAEQLEANGKRTGKFFFVAHSDRSGRVFPIGHCVRCGGHDTPQGARSCFEKWLLDRHLSFDRYSPSSLPEGPCAICGTPTPHGAAIIIDEYSLGWFFRLCPEHRTRDVVARLLHINHFAFVWWMAEAWDNGVTPLTDLPDKLACESEDLQSEKEA